MSDSSVGSDESEGLSMTRCQMQLLAYGTALALFAVADFVMGGRYELHILLDAAGSFCFPVTVLYFFYPKVALWLSLATCVALIMYWVHHMLRQKRGSHTPVTALMMLSSLYIAAISAQDLMSKYPK